MKIPENAKRVFNGKIFDVYQFEQIVFDGTTQIYEMVWRQPANCVIAIFENKIMILDQEQPGRPPYISLPGGRIEKGEDHKKAAQRELLEETGFESDDFELLFSLNDSGKIDYQNDVWIAKNCKKTCEQNLDNGEKIKVNFVNFDDFLELTNNKDLAIPYGLRHEMWQMLIDNNKKTEFRKKLGL